MFFKMFFILAMFFILKKHECFNVTDIDYTEQTINWSHSECESDAE